MNISVPQTGAGALRNPFRLLRYTDMVWLVVVRRLMGSGVVDKGFELWSKRSPLLSINPSPGIHSKHGIRSMTSQRALWLPKIGAEFTFGKNEIPEPGPGEVLVKLEASALNPLDVVIQKSGFFLIKEYPAILGEEGAGVVQKVGDGISNLAQGDRVFVPPLKNHSMLVLTTSMWTGCSRPV